MRAAIREQLLAYVDENYRDFSSALAPGMRPLLGVRLPQLRKIAKDIVKGDWRAEIDAVAEDLWFEETMLRGMIIGYGTVHSDMEEGLSYLKKMMPYVDGWSICDSFCSSFGFADKNRQAVWEFLQPYFDSEQEFEVRIAIIMLLMHFLKYDKNGKKRSRNRVVSMEDLRKDTACVNKEAYPYLEPILRLLNRPYHQGYYAQMAAAWTAAEAFVTFPYETMQMLTVNCKMDEWTRKKTMQKIRESRNPSDEVKEWIKRN